MAYEWRQNERDIYERYIYADWDKIHIWDHYVEIIFGGKQADGEVLTGWQMASEHWDAWVPVPGPPRNVEEAKASAIATWRMQ